MAEDVSSAVISPISVLPPEILWIIFEKNTYTTSWDRIRPLSTCVRTSRVCHLWRDIMLNSPSFWGRLIELAHPFLVKRTWREEILNRSGVAPLWVLGAAKTKPVSDYLLRIVNNHWERIQVFDVQPFAKMRTTLTADELWAAMLRPAPLLREFRFSSFSQSFLFTKSTIPLFSDNAPCLEEFFVSRVSFSLEASWISTVRAIHLTTPFTLAEVLGALKRMKCVRHLVTGTFGDGDPHVIVVPTPVQFSHLRLLELRHSPLEMWLPLLESIFSKTTCVLQLISSCPPGQFEPPESTLQIACNHILRFMGSAIANYTASSMAFKLGRYHGYPFEFQISFPENVKQTQTYLHLLDYPALSRLLMQRLSSSSLLSGATILDLQILGNDPSVLLPELQTMMATFTSLTSLKISDWMLDPLIQHCDALVLPNLHTLVIKELEQAKKWPESWKERYPSGILLTFLRHRKSFEVPVSILDLLNVDVYKFSEMEHLDEILGLTVRYKHPLNNDVMEYLCGSSRPQSLRF